MFLRPTGSKVHRKETFDRPSTSSPLALSPSPHLHDLKKTGPPPALQAKGRPEQPGGAGILRAGSRQGPERVGAAREDQGPIRDRQDGCTAVGNRGQRGVDAIVMRTSAAPCRLDSGLSSRKCSCLSYGIEQSGCVAGCVVRRYRFISSTIFFKGGEGGGRTRQRNGVLSPPVSVN